MWNLKVPKRMFFYWGGKALPFLRYMSVYSFQKLNPDWEIRFYAPVQVSDFRPWHGKQFESAKDAHCKDYSNQVRHELGIKPILYDFEALGLSNELNEVQKSDLLRYDLLVNQGGVWADMDVLFIKPMDELLCNKENSTASAFYYYGIDTGVLGHAIGFLMSEPGSKYYTDVSAVAKSNFRPNDYQGAGPDLLNRLFPIDKVKRDYPDAVSVDKESVYAIDHLASLYRQYNPDFLTDNSIGIHWYGGCTEVEQLLLNVDHANYLGYPNHGTLMTVLRQTFPTL